MKIQRVGLLGSVVLVTSTMAMAGPSGGTIRGKVTYQGTPAKMKAIDMSKEPSCAKCYSTPPTSESVITGPGNTLAAVLVYVSAGLPDESAPPTAAVFKQKGCRYIPHVLPLQVNQELKITNEDQAIHNIHAIAKLNPEWNKSQMPGSPAISEKYAKAEMIPVKCNIHPWMRGTFAVLKNSHYALSGESGAFTLAKLPPGKYTITAWQELYGEQSQEVTITGSETKTITFVFQVNPY